MWCWLATIQVACRAWCISTAWHLQGKNTYGEHPKGLGKHPKLLPGQREGELDHTTYIIHCLLSPFSLLPMSSSRSSLANQLWCKWWTTGRLSDLFQLDARSVPFSHYTVNHPLRSSPSCYFNGRIFWSNCGCSRPLKIHSFSSTAPLPHSAMALISAWAPTFQPFLVPLRGTELGKAATFLWWNHSGKGDRPWKSYCFQQQQHFLVGRWKDTCGYKTLFSSSCLENSVVCRHMGKSQWPRGRKP